MSRKMIYIVDDHAAVLRVLKLGLQEAGYEVEASSNGSECLLKLVERHPDFLVTDIDMPRMSGKELCLAIQEQYPERRFPIVVLTSRTELEHRDWTREMNDLAFMEKPVSVRRLVAHIDRCLSENEQAATG